MKEECLMKMTGALMLCLLMTCCSGTRPATLGVREGRLLPCPDSPNCVSTQALDERHRMEPIAFGTTLEEAKQRLIRVISSMPRARIVTDSGEYVHAEFTSRIFRFVDDVEFYLDDAARLIQFRSASRVGYSDLGVNRKRMEEISQRFLGTATR
jgi:uncharacterized protein (DUF1499 family)